MQIVEVTWRPHTPLVLGHVEGDLVPLANVPLIVDISE